MAVDGAGAADYLALGDVPRPLHSVDGAGQCPIVGSSPQFGFLGVSVFEVVRQRFQVRVVRPGLQQQHRPLRVLGQTGRQYTAGRTGADNDYIILHNYLTLSVLTCRLHSYSISRSVQNLPGFLENRVEHCFGQLSGIGILLAGVIGANQDDAVVQVMGCAVTKGRSGLWIG